MRYTHLEKEFSYSDIIWEHAEERNNKNGSEKCECKEREPK